MSQIEIVAPVMHDGIEFYVSTDKSKCGVSQVGLSRLSGISERSMRRTLTTIQARTRSAKNSETDENSDVSADAQNLANLIYQEFGSVRLYLDLGSNQQAKVVDAKIAARIITYYAFESSKCTQEARYSLQKFCSKGMRQWIMDVTGHAESGNIFQLMQSLSSQLNLMQKDITDMKVQLFQTEGYRAARVTLPGLKEWMENLEVAEYNRLALPGSAEEELFTLNEWATKAQNGLVLSKSNKHALANNVSSVYKTMSLEMPPKVVRLDAKGYRKPAVQAYPERHFVLINMVYSRLVAI
jgi:hypothetical protein